MPIYDKSTRELMHQFVQERVGPGKVFTRADVVTWFKEHYPKIKSNTVALHVDGMSVNSQSREHHKHIRPGKGWDLFLKLDRSNYRLWDQVGDPPPKYQGDFSVSSEVERSGDETEEAPALEGSAEFALESDLQRYLVKNLTVLEPGLTLYKDADGEFDGVEFSAGGRFIDVLAIGKDGSFVVVELKVSKGYDRVIGQLLRYMAWVQKNLSEERTVRGIIVASEISEDLKLAASLIPNVSLFRYELSFSISKI